MINREQFNRALRLSLAIFVISLLILGALWINFLYSRFRLESEAYRTEVESTIEKSNQAKVQILVQQADRLYDEEMRTLKERMQDRMAVIKSNLFEYADLSRDTLEERIISDGQRYFTRTGIVQAIDSEKLMIKIGNQNWLGNFRTRSFNTLGDLLVYSDYSAATRSVIQLSIDQKLFLQTQLENWIRDYHELDPYILLMDREGSPLADTEPVTEQFGEAHYFALAQSDKSGFTLGYYTPRRELDLLIQQRSNQFTSFLNNHLIEIAAFLSLFGITLAVFFRLTAGQLKRQIGSLNDEIIRRYRNPSAEDGELYREYGLSRAVDTVVADAQKNSDYLEMLERKHEKELKQSRIELLQMQRRFEFMLDKTKTKMVTQFTPLRDEIDIRELIEQAHLDLDGSKNLRLVGEEDVIVSDRTFLQTLIETFFRLSSDEKRRYQIEYLVEQGAIKLFLTLINVTVLDSEGIERIKYLAEMLGGSVLRLYQSDEKFSLVLRLSAE